MAQFCVDDLYYNPTSESAVRALCVPLRASVFECLEGVESSVDVCEMFEYCNLLENVVDWDVVLRYREPERFEAASHQLCFDVGSVKEVCSFSMQVLCMYSVASNIFYWVKSLFKFGCNTLKLVLECPHPGF